MTTDTKQFTSRRPAIPFEIDGEKFEAYGAAPTDFMEELLATLRASSGSDQGTARYVQLKERIAQLLVPEYRDRFFARLGDFSDPISIDVFADLTNWLIEQVSGRPTQPPGLSTTAPGEDGTTSMDGAPVETSTPTVSPGTATST